MAAPFRSLLQDGDYAIRSLRRNPGFALFTAAVIGLGIGAATSVFNVLEPLVLAPLPFRDAERLVWIANEAEPGDNSLSSVTSRSANLRDFRERSRSFEGLTAYNAFFDHAACTLPEPANRSGWWAPTSPMTSWTCSGSSRSTAGASPRRKGCAGAPRVVILSHGLWRRRFSADPGVVGGSLIFNGRPRTVVGVLPPTFDFSSVFSPGVHVDLLLPFPVIDAGEDGGGLGA